VVVLLPLLAATACAQQAEGGMAAAMEAMLEGNFAEAYCLWKPLAEQGEPEAQYHIGWLYANGNGLRVDTERAVEWWRRAAEQGLADAQFAIGLAATTGDGMARDLNAAVAWYGLAARQGHEDARDILLQLAADPGVRVLEQHPEFVDEPWFGWRGSVSADAVNVRAGPGTQEKVVGQLEQATEVRVIARSGAWLRIVPPAQWQDVESAWVHGELVDEQPGADG
jgi:uncharacterized protein YgiM (DUF1202 family)